jgi:uncharacterized membrane protein
MTDPVAPEPAGSEHHKLHDALQRAETHLAPAWRRVSDGEARWPASAAVLVALALQIALPERLTLGKTWIIPAGEGVVLLALTITSPRRISAHSPRARAISLILIAAMTVANVSSATRLVRGLINGTEGTDPNKLLATGAAIWLTNVVIFSLWYWEFDRNGPGARAEATNPHPDFVFPQMSSPELAPHDWQPTFADYLYLSFTNATAFSPTDTLPFSHWAKMMMMIQSAVSLITVGLVIARAVNILK